MPDDVRGYYCMLKNEVTVTKEAENAKKRTIYNLRCKRPNLFFTSFDTGRAEYLKSFIKERDQPSPTPSVWFSSSKSEIINEAIAQIGPFASYEKKWQFIIELSTIAAALYRLILGNTQPKSYSVSKEKNGKTYYHRMIKRVESCISFDDFLSDPHTKLMPETHNFSFHSKESGATRELPMRALLAGIIASIYVGDEGEIKPSNFVVIPQQSSLRAVRIDPECSFANWLDTEEELMELLCNPIERLSDDRMLSNLLEELGEKEGCNNDEEGVKEFIRSEYNQQEIYATLARIFSIPFDMYMDVVNKFLSDGFAMQKHSLIFLMVCNHLNFIDAAMKMPGFNEFYASYNASQWPDFFGGNKMPCKPLHNLKQDLLKLCTDISSILMPKIKECLSLALHTQKVVISSKLLPI